MKKITLLLTTFFLITLFLNAASNRCFAAVFFASSTNATQMRSDYQNAKKGGDQMRILLVPGHDQEVWGTEYKKVKEADLNYQMAYELYKALSKEKVYDVILARDKFNYAPELALYFETQKAEISAFRKDHKQVLNVLTDAKIIENTSATYHNSVNEETANKLYGLNKWANENKIDLVLHIHFNDTPERKWDKVGPYRGFTIYVPNNQFSNARPSIELGGSILEQMRKYFAISNMKNETNGVIEDQKLIALGAANTLKPAAVLIEYGYIYRPQIISAKTRPALFKKMAKQTVTGIVNFFEGK
jgi:N-acetylmuramoyl-L-alanine amidase